jgi:hypothetical protein
LGYFIANLRPCIATTIRFTDQFANFVVRIGCPEPADASDAALYPALHFTSTFGFGYVQIRNANPYGVAAALTRANGYKLCYMLAGSIRIGLAGLQHARRKAQRSGANCYVLHRESPDFGMNLGRQAQFSRFATIGRHSRN